MDAINAGRDMLIIVHQVKYLKNIVEQDHRAIKRLTKSILHFKSFRSDASVLACIELIHMIRKGQFTIDGADAMSFADQFSALARMSVQFKECSDVPRKSRRLINAIEPPNLLITLSGRLALLVLSVSGIAS